MNEITIGFVIGYFIISFMFAGIFTTVSMIGTDDELDARELLATALLIVLFLPFVMVGVAIHEYRQSTRRNRIATESVVKK